MDDNERETVEYDVVIAGGGPAGLATAIRLMQLARAANRDMSVCVLEKAAEIGAHSISGAILDTRGLDELIPDWRAHGAPVTERVRQDDFYFLRNASSALRVPGLLVPPAMRNAGRYVVSLGELCRWLGDRAEALGVDLLPGFAARDLVVSEAGSVVGVTTSDRGVSRSGERKANFEPGIVVRARHVVLAEGSRGHLARRLAADFEPHAQADPQHYAIGLKEIWEVRDDRFAPGRVIHGAGWPLAPNATGGFFCYHGAHNRVAIGLIADLNYENPSFNPYAEFQRLKHHRVFREMLVDARRVAYGARAITKGGLNSLPRLGVPGALLVGCDAGTLDFARIKGIHTAMGSGIVAAETIFDAWLNDELDGRELGAYRARLLSSWVGRELRHARNMQPALHRFGPLAGAAYVFLDQALLRGRTPWTLHDRVPDHAALRPIADVPRLEYARPDGRLSFDMPSSVYLSGTNHEEDQPSHLTLTDPSAPIAFNLPQFDAPEQRYCPAGVYEVVHEAGHPRLQVNAQNCLHCKVCDIKDPRQNIVWVPPEDGGPSYTNM
jgi:electron-transferring-flavoprotein dehydrogenase